MLSRIGPRALHAAGALVRPTYAPGRALAYPHRALLSTPQLQRSLRSYSQKRQPSPKKPRAAVEPDKPAAPDANAAPPESPEVSEQTQVPLHDLTKGIPSTLDAELAAATRATAEEDEAAVRPAAGGRGGRRMPNSAYETSAEKRKNKIFGYALVMMALGAVGSCAYLGRDWANLEEERQHPQAPSGWGPMLFYNRLKARLTSTLDYYNEPAFPKLLPDPDPAWERPYTLVISLEDMLIHSEWTRAHGWRLAKRPGVDYFLRYLSQYYEIVIFTSLPSMYAMPIIQKLDPFNVAMWSLFREATRYTKGKYIKDLSYLNRDLSKVMLVDTDPNHASLQPENSIILPKWKGSTDDKDLVSLIPFLEYVAALGLPDTRQVLESYKGTESVAVEFARREAIAREKFQAQMQEQGKRPRKGAGMGFVGKALGIKSGQGMVPIPEMAGIPTFSEGLEQGMMLHDQLRLRGQRQYALIEKEIRENGEKWLQEIAAGEEKAKEEAIKGMKSNFSGWMGQKPPKPEGQEE